LLTSQVAKVFLFIELTASTAQIIQIGWVMNSPNPTVGIATIGVTIIMMIAPGTVAYNIPNGPKKKESKKAVAAVFCTRITTSIGF
jgi:hypothetical protein